MTSANNVMLPLFVTEGGREGQREREREMERERETKTETETERERGHRDGLPTRVGRRSEAGSLN